MSTFFSIFFLSKGKFCFSDNAVCARRRKNKIEHVMPNIPPTKWVWLRAGLGAGTIAHCGGRVETTIWRAVRTVGCAAAGGVADNADTRRYDGRCGRCDGGQQTVRVLWHCGGHILASVICRFFRTRRLFSAGGTSGTLQHKRRLILAAKSARSLPTKNPADCGVSIREKIKKFFGAAKYRLRL